MCQESETKLWLTPSHSACCPALRRANVTVHLPAHRGYKKEEMETRIEHKSVLAVGSVISLSFHALWLCVWKQIVYLYCNSSPLSVFYVPLFPYFQCLYSELKIKKVQRERFEEKTISQSEWRGSMSNRVVTPHHTTPFCVFILLSCSCCCIVKILRTNKDSAELSMV